MKEMCCPQCPEMRGFRFEYPVFKGWEVKARECKPAGSCVLWLKWPQTIQFEIAPKIIIRTLSPRHMELAEYQLTGSAPKKDAVVSL